MDAKPGSRPRIGGFLFKTEGNEWNKGFLPPAFLGYLRFLLFKIRVQPLYLGFAPRRTIGY